MDSSIIVALILGFASIISSICFGLVPGIRRNELQRMKEKGMIAAEDLELFYDIEDALLDQLSKATNQNKTSLKIQNRNAVSTKYSRKLSKFSCPSGIETLKQAFK